MRLDERVQVALFFDGELFENLPAATDDLEMAVVLKLPNEEDHLLERDTRVVEVVGKFCR